MKKGKAFPRLFLLVGMLSLIISTYLDISANEHQSIAMQRSKYHFWMSIFTKLMCI
jgi:hypothetical protein